MDLLNVDLLPQNLMEAMNDWTLAVQDKHAVTIAYIDFSRAFDSVSHDILDNTAKPCGIMAVLHITYYDI